MSKKQEESHCCCCGCGHEHGHEHGGNHHDIYYIIAGAVLFLAGIIFQNFFDIKEIFIIVIYILSYIITGHEVIIHAVKNLFKGKMLDENFLMTVSSVAAFCIGSYSEAAAIMLFYNIGEYFQGIAVKRSKKSISDLMDICVDTANVIRGGEILNVPAETLHPGDVILIKPGEKIPLDSVILKGSSQIDTSALTGESKLTSVTVGSRLLSGTINNTGSLEARVEKEFSESTASKIIKLVESAADKKAPAEKFITAFARVYTPIVVILALMIAIIPSVIFGGLIEWIRRGCVFLVISCPCALVVSIPLTFFGGIGVASKKGILIKGGNYLEVLSKVKTVVFDKTGTLTEGNFGVSDIIPEKGYTKEDVIKVAATAEQVSTHPIALSIMEYLGTNNLSGVLESINEPGRGIKVKTETSDIVVGSEELMKSINVDYKKYEGYETAVYVSENGKYIGAIILSDKIKDETKSALLSLKKSGIKNNIMLTGDVKSVAKSVTDEVDIDEFYAELLPQDKVSIFEKIKSKYDKKIAFVGDGINDAPVLAISDIGIAMGGIGSDAAIEAADVVIMNDELSKISEGITIAKKTKRIVTQNIVFSLGVKAVFLILGAFGVAGMWEAVFGDVGVMLLAVVNSMRVLKK